MGTWSDRESSEGTATARRAGLSLTAACVASSMPMNITCRVTHWPLTWKESIAGTATVGVMPAIESPAARRISSMCQPGSRKPESEWLSKTMAERMP